MNSHELAFGVVVVVVLLALAAYFGWRQVRALRQLRDQPDMSEEERTHFRTQAWRRLLGSALMLVLAGLLIGSYFLDQEYRHITEQHADKGGPMQPDEREFLQRFTMYWVVALAVVFLFGMFAMFDIIATLKYGVRAHRKLRDQHRAALEAEVRRIRQQRNGDHR